MIPLLAINFHWEVYEEPFSFQKNFHQIQVQTGNPTKSDSMSNLRKTEIKNVRLEDLKNVKYLHQHL